MTGWKQLRNGAWSWSTMEFEEMLCRAIEMGNKIYREKMERMK